MRQFHIMMKRNSERSHSINEAMIIVEKFSRSHGTFSTTSECMWELSLINATGVERDSLRRAI